MPPFEVARAYAFERVLVQMEKHVGKSVWELIGEDRKIGDDDLRVPIHFVSPSSGCNVRPQHSQLENVAHEPLTLGRAERFAAAPRPARLGDGRRADGGTRFGSPENMSAWTVDELADFLIYQDLQGPAEALRSAGVNGADFLSWRLGDGAFHR